MSEKWVFPEGLDNELTASFNGVCVKENEEVEFHYCCSNGRKICYGYTIYTNPISYMGQDDSFDDDYDTLETKIPISKCPGHIFTPKNIFNISRPDSQTTQIEKVMQFEECIHCGLTKVSEVGTGVASNSY